MSEVETIEVTFKVDLPVGQIKQLQAQLEELSPGSVAYVNVWEQIKAIHTYFLGRLDGECQAYMNIAKERVRQIVAL